jgi:hypothetical protein
MSLLPGSIKEENYITRVGMDDRDIYSMTDKYNFNEGDVNRCL